jgi:hypothetical protein
MQPSVPCIAAAGFYGGNTVSADDARERALESFAKHL